MSIKLRKPQEYITDDDAAASYGDSLLNAYAKHITKLNCKFATDLCVGFTPKDGTCPSSTGMDTEKYCSWLEGQLQSVLEDTTTYNLMGPLFLSIRVFRDILASSLTRLHRILAGLDLDIHHNQQNNLLSAAAVVEL